LNGRVGKEIHWIEWGIGGGASQNGDTPAATALEAAYYPYWGIWGPYNASRDPWQNPDVRAYMHHYVNMTSQYLLQVGAVCVSVGVPPVVETCHVSASACGQPSA
jgi:hypothetical protein